MKSKQREPGSVTIISATGEKQVQEKFEPILKQGWEANATKLLKDRLCCNCNAWLRRGTLALVVERSNKEERRINGTKPPTFAYCNVLCQRRHSVTVMADPDKNIKKQFYTGKKKTI